MELFWHFYVHPSGEFPDQNFNNLAGSLCATQRLDEWMRYDAVMVRPIENTADVDAKAAEG